MATDGPVQVNIDRNDGRTVSRDLKKIASSAEFVGPNWLG
jgi:hypothetical protein